MCHSTDVSPLQENMNQRLSASFDRVGMIDPKTQPTPILSPGPQTAIPAQNVPTCQVEYFSTVGMTDQTRRSKQVPTTTTLALVRRAVNRSRFSQPPHGGKGGGSTLCGSRRCFPSVDCPTSLYTWLFSIPPLLETGHRDPCNQYRATENLFTPCCIALAGHDVQ